MSPDTARIEKGAHTGDDRIRVVRLPTGAFRLTARLQLPVEGARVFAFFSDPANLGAITPPEMRFRMLTPAPIAMRPGALIDYTIRVWGVPLKWRTRIARWDPGRMFVDEQLRGPYRSWVHSHRFHAVPGGTVIEDEVVYALRFGVLGRVAAPLVRRQLVRIFQYRQKRVRELVGRESPGSR
ncbi:MAG TPA: SRPBCC family protein [Gemmatimonadaceae bacterium]